MLTLISPVPGAAIRSDSDGDGRFGAPRGGRRHVGLDLVAPKGCAVVSPLSGRVVRLGYPYADDLYWRLVEIEGEGLIVRLLYVSPLVEVGQRVEAEQIVGRSQGIAAKYSPEMTDHVHLDVRLSPAVMLWGKTGRSPADTVYLDPAILLDTHGGNHGS